MKKLIIITIALLISVTACKKEEEEKLPVEGKWSLISFAQDDYQEVYEEGKIFWEFNKYKELIVEVNTDLSNSQLPITEPGTYKYIATEKVISLNNVQYAVSVENGILTLDHNYATGGSQIKLAITQEEN